MRERRRTPAPGTFRVATLVTVALLAALAAPLAAEDIRAIEAGDLLVDAKQPLAKTAEPAKDDPAPLVLREIPAEAWTLAPTDVSLDVEVESNGTPAEANALDGSGAAIRGDIWPAADNDFFSFEALAGDKVYASTQTNVSSGSNDTTIEVIASDGTTVLDSDLNDGSFGGSAASVAGTVIPASGTYYLRVIGGSPTTTVRQYDLYLRVQSGAPTAEVEDNDTTATANPLPAGGWVSGTVDAVNPEWDFFSVVLAAGDTVFISLDMNPERDANTWNGRAGLGLFGSGAPSFVLLANDAAATGNNSEAFFFTVRDAGTYFVAVDSIVATGLGPNATYELSVTVIPSSDATANCTTYTSSDVPVVIPPDPPGSPVQSTITVPGNPRIADLNVTVEIDHTFAQDLDVQLISPAGNANGLFTDIGGGATPQTDLRVTFDDEAGLSPAFAVGGSYVVQPEINYRLSFYDREDAGGTWTLVIRDDAAGDSGSLNAWSLRICEPVEPEPQCPPGTAPVTVYESDFEVDDGGFTHSGTLDEWERGLPSFGAITTCASGASCWKTDLDNTYDASSIQDLLSPSIDLAGLLGPVVVRWSQRFQIESASFDHWAVSAREVGNPTNEVLLHDWRLNMTRTEAFGATPSNVTGEPSSGWAPYVATADSLAGLSAELLFHFDSDSSVQLTGPAIDDVSVTACEPGNPEITMAKTVGLVSGVCGVDETLTVEHGTPVTYCYTVTNTGSVTLTSHTLVDDQLGTILENEPLVLDPGDSAFVTVDDVFLDATTTNEATWTASDSDSTTACSAGGITVTGASGSPYPSTATLAGATTTPDRVAVTLDGVTHTFTSDLDALLVGPNAGNLIVMSDVSLGEANAGIDLFLDDAGPAPLPAEGPLASGTFRPADYVNKADDFPAPAPTPPYGTPEPTGTDTFASEFGGADPNGTWNLFVTDAFPTADDGSIDGWCISAIEDLFEVSATDSVTVTVLVPDIAVDPASLSSFQAVDTQVVEQLDITNNGDATLDWTIAETDGLGGRVRTARVPGRQEPIRAHRRLPAPESEGLTAATESFGRAETSEAGRRIETERGLVPDGSVTITHSATQSIVVGNSVSCNAGGLHTDNSYIRRFDLGAFGITGNFDVVEVSFGIEQALGAGGDQPVTVNLYTWDPADPFTFANFSLIGTANGAIPDQSGTVAIFPVSGTAPAGSTLVVELFTPNGQVEGNGLFVGSNADGQTDPTFLAAADCGVVDPTDTAVIGFPDMHWVLNVTGQAGCDVDLPWVSVAPDNGATAPATTDTVDVTFDSTGLTLGGIYTGSLCVESDDPDTPTVLVPLTLEVDSMPFLDGFESGDTSQWTATQP